MSTRSAVALGLSVVVLLAGVGPVAGGAPTERAVDGETAVGADGTGADRMGASADETDSDEAVDDRAAQYEVSLRNVTVDTWLLRNSTVRNATVREVRIRNATTPDGTKENVTLRNVTVGEFVIDRGRLRNVTAQTLVIRNKSILDVPGGDFIDPDVRDRTLERHVTRNQTVSGVVIDTLEVEAGIMGDNAAFGVEADDAAEFSPVAAENDPDITIENGAVREALVRNGTANDWSVESIDGDAGDDSGPEKRESDNR
ncbi:hypothetical protein [Halorussus amylolyticus]|uniref:hypothetical protein n=1 Tax=Halorussus amylolyticus TaxID=1126242 RepID=UPI00104C54FC|nr:hypothetical protein [Halorussus amylolyticus]